MADLDRLLAKTSRTFALSIPLLPEPTRREVGIAYLLFRIADTFEDATLWEPRRRIEALAELASLLRGTGSAAEEAAARRWTGDPPCAQEGYLELLRESPTVLGDFRSLSAGAVSTIRERVVASAEGMARFVGRMSPDGELRLADLDDLRSYCYVVAGIVGEMLTDLFLLGRDGLAPIAGFLRERAARFGEALQLVNIVKDAGSDRSEGRSYLPESVSRAEVFELARRDLAEASEYVLALQRAGAPEGLVGFTALPVELAWETLDRVEKHGPGTKVPRTQVYRIVARLKRNLERGRPAARRH
ncbi:MAG TPA: squalene/phytoene synthase family protein [Thermoanaerobaculia bacterium]|jgi:farnesyl-diphosphate farnesyltransferase|nr:squalene/phytoene synthase family protein [Thermoanaerobaculia bacterium]